MRGRVARAALLAVAALALALAWAALAPMDPDPVAWTPPPAPPEPSAVLAPNDSLARVERLEVGGRGPEDVAWGPDGRLYAGLDDGRIVRLAAGGAAETFASTAGRPLGLRFGRDGNLLVADASRGLLSISPSGMVKVLSSAHEGRAYGLADDLDVARDGTVYFSDATDEYALGDSEAATVAHRARGRLLAHAPDGSVRLVRDGLAFANGVALAEDESFVLVAETASYRILRCWLAGERRGTCGVFADGLPGFPDGVTRGQGGLFWVALYAPRNALLDRAHPHPALKRVLLRLPSWMQPAPRAHGWILALDGDGRIVHSLQDPTGQAFAFVTNVVEHEGSLYVGSLHLPYVGRIGRSR